MTTLADRVKETTTTTGTGTLDLAGAVTGFQGFVAGAGDATEVYYTIVGQAGGGAEGEWEVGIGTVTDAATDTLSRDTVLASSNSGSAVNFSAGTKDVFITLPAGRLAEAVLPVLHVRDEKSSGTSGGSSSATTWNVRDLNTVVTNQISGASLASNQITLPAGTYRVEAIAPSHRPGATQLRIRNVTDDTTELVGMTGFEGNSDNSSGAQHVRGRITLADTKVLELHHYTGDAKATNGLGVAASSGEGEVYATVWIEKEA